MSVREGNVKYDVFTSDPIVFWNMLLANIYVLPLTHRNMHAFSTAEIYAGERVHLFSKRSRNGCNKITKYHDTSLGLIRRARQLTGRRGATFVLCTTQLLRQFDFIPCWMYLLIYLPPIYSLLLLKCCLPSRFVIVDFCWYIYTCTYPRVMFNHHIDAKL